MSRRCNFHVKSAGAPGVTSESFVFCPSGAVSSFFFCLQRACALGCILSPLCGWVAMGPRLIAALKRCATQRLAYASLKRRGSTALYSYRHDWKSCPTRSLLSLDIVRAKQDQHQNQHQRQRQRTGVSVPPNFRSSLTGLDSSFCERTQDSVLGYCRSPLRGYGQISTGGMFRCHSVRKWEGVG